MKKKNLKLEDLTLSSFETSLERKNKETIQGGWTPISVVTSAIAYSLEIKNTLKNPDNCLSIEATPALDPIATVIESVPGHCPPETPDIKNSVQVSVDQIKNRLRSRLQVGFICTEDFIF